MQARFMKGVGVLLCTFGIILVLSNLIWQPRTLDDLYVVGAKMVVGLLVFFVGKMCLVVSIDIKQERGKYAKVVQNHPEDDVQED